MVSASRFWEGERERLRDAVKGLKGQRSASSFYEELKQLASPQQDFPEPGTFGRFLKGESPIREAGELTGLLFAAARLPADGHWDEAATALLRQLKRDFDDRVELGPRAIRPPPGWLEQLLGISSEDALSVRPCLLKEGETRAFFVAYRYDSEAGQIMKTFMEVEAPNGAMPACAFTSWVSNEPASKPDQTPRQTRGVVLPASETLNLIGQIQGGAGNVLVTLKRPPAPREEYYGLVITFNGRYESIMSRVLYVRTQKASFAEAKVGVYSENDPDLDIEGLDRGKFLRAIRNSVSLNLDQEVFYDGQHVEPKELVTRVHDVITSKGGEPFRFKDGREFNPACDEHYAFNSAIKL